MKILYLTFDDLSAPSAGSIHVRSIVNGLAARGHELRVVCPGGKAPGVRAGCDALAPGKLAHLAGSLRTFVASGKAFDPDVIYVRGIHATLTPALAAGRLGKPLVVEINGLLEHEVKGWRRLVVRKAHRFTLRRTARVVAVSPLLKNALVKRYDFPAGRIDVVPNGVDTTLFKPSDRAEARKKLSLPADARIVVCVAGFFAHHALDLLVDAAGKAGATLLLVGKEGPSGGRILHAGRVAHERVPDYLAAADLCAYVLRTPHPDFGFSPLKVYEYMAAGRAVVAAADLEEIRGFVLESRIGLAVTPDPENLARAMQTMLADPRALEEMGRRGRLLAESRFSWDRAAGQVEASLRSAVAP